MLPKFPPVPPGVTLEKVDTLPQIRTVGRRGQPSKYAWLFERLLAMKPGDQIYRLTVTDKKAKDLHHHALQKWIRDMRQDQTQRKSWQVKIMSTNGGSPDKPYYLFIDCVVFDPVAGK